MPESVVVVPASAPPEPLPAGAEAGVVITHSNMHICVAESRSGSPKGIRSPYVEFAVTLV
jgi:hypothetical protein